MSLLDAIGERITLERLGSLRPRAERGELPGLLGEPNLPSIVRLLTGSDTLTVEGGGVCLDLYAPRGAQRLALRHDECVSGPYIAVLPLIVKPPYWIPKHDELAAVVERVMHDLRLAAPPYDYRGVVVTPSRSYRIDYVKEVKAVVEEEDLEAGGRVSLHVYKPVLYGMYAYASHTYRVSRGGTLELSFSALAVKSPPGAVLLDCITEKCRCTVSVDGEVECSEGEVAVSRQERVGGNVFWRSIIAKIYSRMLDKLTRPAWSTWLHIPPCMVLLDYRLREGVLELLLWNACPHAVSGCLRIRGYKVLEAHIDGVEHPLPPDSYDEACLFMEAFGFTRLALRIKKAPAILLGRRRGRRLC